MKKLKNEKGFTLFEILLAFVIFTVIFSSISIFIQTIEVRKSDLGEYDTAKFLLIEAVESERLKINAGEKAVNSVTNNTYTVNGVNYTVSVSKEIAPYAYYTNKVDLFQIHATISWKLKKLEVDTYVTEI